MLNQQGDVIAIIDVQGNVLVRYYYNAWGLEVAEYTGARSADHPLRQYNALKYRGYYYDAESGFYYVSSRYYDPEIGRFINADDIDYLGADGSLLSYNQFAYCDNNPVVQVDSTGKIGVLAIGVIIAAGGIVGAAMGAFSAAATGGDIIESTIEGTLTGLAGTACGLLISPPFTAVCIAAASGYVIDVGTQATSQYVKTGDVNLSEIDGGRAVKTAFYTGIGTLIKPLPGAGKNTIDVLGTILGWGECSTLLTCIDIIVTNTYNTKSVGEPTKGKTVQSKNNTCRITTTTADYFKQLYSGA